MSEIRLKLHYEHGEADNNEIDLYDGAQSLLGMSRALNIITHAFLHGEVRQRADSVKGARIMLLPAQRGSFIEQIRIIISDDPIAAALVLGLGANAIWDFMKWGFREAIGMTQDEPKRALKERIEPVIGELGIALEPAIAQIHRPILENGAMQLSVTRPRGEKIITFNSETAKATIPLEGPTEYNIAGNVTRFNVLSGWGRLYDRAEGRTISFKLASGIPDRAKLDVTWSLDRVNNRDGGTLYFTVIPTTTPSGRIKRYLILDAHRAVRDAQ